MEGKKELIMFKTIDIVQIGLMAAVIYIVTFAINIPYYTGVIHLGDSMVFISAILLGSKKAAVASAIGMCLFDLLSPYAIWAPFTFVIKGIMALIAASIAYRRNYNGNSFWNNVFAFTVASIWMIVGYYLGGIILYHYYFKLNWMKSYILPLNDVAGNIVQVLCGMAIALSLGTAIKKSIGNKLL